MISCKDAKHLFDRYLNGELNASLQTELHAHRLHCIDCQNELALLEACGDVIALDRREPTVSASFTDRVMLAHRAQMKPVRRRWAKTLLAFGSPMAAAACVALMLSVMRGAPQNSPVTVVAPYVEVAPPEFRKIIANRELSDEEQKQFDSSHAMTTSSFIESLLAPVVEKSKNTAEGARQNAENLLERLRESLSSTNERLLADWRSAHPSSDDQVGPPAPSDAASASESSDNAPKSPMGEPIRNPL
jgi:ElaB/YqjD/DUF883 family membrane-anchored ribosome-binding protein